MIRKNLPLLSSFLRIDRKCSELTKAGSAPAYFNKYLFKTSFPLSKLFFIFNSCLILKVFMLVSTSNENVKI